MRNRAAVDRRGVVGRLEVPAAAAAFARGDDERRRLDAGAKRRAGGSARLSEAIRELRDAGWFPWEAPRV